MSRVIAYDLCRLFVGPYFTTPRGIDRVDLAVAKQVFAGPDSQHIGILPTPLGTRAYSAHFTRLLLTQLQILWREDSEAEHDPRLLRLIEDMRSLRGQTPLDMTATGLSRVERIRRCLALWHEIGMNPGQAAVKAVPCGATYVNLGQLALAMPSFFNWLQRRPDVQCAMMIHDTIPIDHPELVKPASVAHHTRMIATVAAHADCMIFTTDFARERVQEKLVELGRRPPPSLVRSLPVPAAFAEPRESVAGLAGQHYFVVVSTVEPRKNHTLLIRIWEALVARIGERAPHLVIVGAPGLDAERILAPIATSPRLRERVQHVAGLSSPALAQLVRGCAALLSPSFAEGFGLPLLEGIAMGVPTIASDIPSHREIARDTTLLLDANDQQRWEHAITATPRVAARPYSHVPADMTEAAYSADVLAFLATLSTSRDTNQNRH